MTVAERIIRRVCIHECAHAIVAESLGATVEYIHLFNIGNTGPADNNFVKIKATHLDCGDRASIEVAGCVGERLMQIDGDFFHRYPQTHRVMGGVEPLAGDQRQIPFCVGDGRNFLQLATHCRLSDADLPKALQTSEQHATHVLQAQIGEFEKRVADTQGYVKENEIHLRVPPDGVPGDGEQWWFRYPGKPVIRSIEEFIDQYVWFKNRELVN